jgi:hypothetical protein
MLLIKMIFSFSTFPLKKHKPFAAQVRISILAINANNIIHKRWMWSTVWTHACRPLFACSAMIGNRKLQQLNTVELQKSLSKEIVKLCHDHDSGSATIKTALLSHMFPGKIPLREIYEITPKVIVDPVSVDFRSLKESVIFNELLVKHKDSIVFARVTGDTNNAHTMLPGQAQPNPDWIITVQDTQTGMFINRPFDEKSGTGLYRAPYIGGNIGIFLYDQETGLNVQTTSFPITHEHLFTFHEKRNAGVLVCIEQNKIGTYPSIRQLIGLNPKTLDEFEVLQKRLWNELLCDGNYYGSLSLVFPKAIFFGKLTPEQEKFKALLISELGTKKYSLFTSIEDRRAVTKAMVIAYQSVYDAQIIKNILYLHEQKISINPEFLQDILSIQS